jgi:Sec-independent protein translocase protein TatA
VTNSDRRRKETTAAEDLREVIREANSATKALRQAIREARALTRDTITADLNERMAEMRQHVTETMQDGIARITAEHQALGDLLMQRGRRAEAAGLPPLEQVVQAAARGVPVVRKERRANIDVDPLDGEGPTRG